MWWCGALRRMGRIPARAPRKTPAPAHRPTAHQASIVRPRSRRNGIGRFVATVKHVPPRGPTPAKTSRRKEATNEPLHDPPTSYIIPCNWRNFKREEVCANWSRAELPDLPEKIPLSLHNHQIEKFSSSWMWWLFQSFHLTAVDFAWKYSDFPPV